MALDDFLNGRTVTASGHCYDTVFHLTVDGGSIAIGEGDWSLEIDGRIIETSYSYDSTVCLQMLVGRTITGVELQEPDHCALTFSDGTVLRCSTGTLEGGEVGHALLTVLYGDAHGLTWLYELCSPLPSMTLRIPKRCVSPEFLGP